jgi:hypothetical protein
MKRSIVLMIIVLGMLSFWTAASYAQCAGEWTQVGQILYCRCHPECCYTNMCNVFIPTSDMVDPTAVSKAVLPPPDIEVGDVNYYLCEDTCPTSMCYIYIPDPTIECLPPG